MERCPRGFDAASCLVGVIDDKDLPLSPRITGPPGIGKTTLAISGDRERKQDTYIFQCPADTWPEDLFITPVLAESGTIAYYASPLVTAMSTRAPDSYALKRVSLAVWASSLIPSLPDPVEHRRRRFVLPGWPFDCTNLNWSSNLFCLCRVADGIDLRDCLRLGTGAFTAAILKGPPCPVMSKQGTGQTKPEIYVNELPPARGHVEAWCSSLRHRLTPGIRLAGYLVCRALGGIHVMFLRQPFSGRDDPSRHRPVAIRRRAVLVPPRPIPNVASPRH